MSDKPNVPGDDQPKPSETPAPWERKPADSQPGGDLSQSLSSANPSEYIEGKEGEADYMAAEEQSLQSRISGGGLDSGGDAGSQESKLCPACGRVTTFVQGVCTNCKHKLGTSSASAHDTQAPAYGMPAVDTGPIIRNIVIAVVLIAALVAIGYFGIKFLGKPAEPGDDQLAGAIDTHPGVLNAVAVDELFHADLLSALEDGNQAWHDEGTDCHVYRYSVFEKVEPAVSQRIIITGFTGGDDVRTAIIDPGKATFDAAFKPFLDELASHSGVDASITLRFTDGEEPPATTDEYIRYGYYYGKEHWTEIAPIVEALEGLRQQDGEYPHSLSEKIVSPKIRTFGNMDYLANGYGYIPEYKVNSKGEIVMGSGSGLAELLPEECTGYYMLVFTPQPKMGIDFLGKMAGVYYRENISPFPYQPKKPVTNVPLEPDGEPDGIACIIYSGDLLRVN